MHNLYYKGRIETRENHVKSGFNTKRAVKAGTAQSPLSLTVTTEERKIEIEEIVSTNNLFANIIIDNDANENISELDACINKPKTTRFEKTPSRNDPCSCGSGKKYKKCCA